MSLRSSISRAVDSAFRAVGDLAQTVSLTSTLTSSYNFSTGDVTTSTSSTEVTAIVIEEIESSTEENISVPVKEVFIKESDLPSPKLYDKVSIASIQHTILSYELSPGLVVLKVTEG